MGRPGVPNWVEAAEEDDRRSGSAPAPEDGGAGPIGGSSRAQAAVSRALVYVLWTGIALALVLGVVNCAGRPAAAPRPGGEADPPTLVPPPSGCAELVVAGWLAGDTAMLAGVPGAPDISGSAGEPERARRAVATYPAAVTPGESAWSYLVAAEVEVSVAEVDPDADPDEAEPPGWRPAGLQYFTVTLVPAASGATGCQGWLPAALPAHAAAPSLAAEAESPYPVTLPTDSPLGATLTSFFTGLLTGGEDLERYLAPDTALAPIEPPPYQEVSVSDIRARTDPTDEPADGTTVRLLATVTTDAGRLPLVYPVTVAVRDGRWEVVAIDPLVGAAAWVQPGQRTNGG